VTIHIWNQPVITAVTAMLASRGTTIEASVTSTIAPLQMPGFLLQNGLSDAELAALRARFGPRQPNLTYVDNGIY
jgi:protein-tyrosine phosphatase